ncbi:hypothetical protein LWI28_011203 [Acer negundo]|uniref:S-acyltransferase n=1 Tax=Acer negundo TaxID=4023 RepID=A0AAD5IVN5_ACENE|nr:hypothetical protein LWI28_011203 [Acer negundo]
MAWNVFKYCSVLRALGSVMILLVLGIIGVSYYAVVVSTYGPALFNGGLDSITAFVVLLLFHFLLAMLLWSYFSVVITDPGGVPPNWTPTLDEERGDNPLVGSEDGGINLISNQSAMQSKRTNHGIRFCQKCNRFKPPRCHHCSVCGRCILKMDHHCVWVVNCVGALNYKYFLLFLFYTFLETGLVTISLLPVFIPFFTDDEIHGTPASLVASFITFVLNLAFVLSIMGFLIMHVSLVKRNTTTIEAFEKKTTPKWHYDLGWKLNFEQVLGKNKNYWFIPAYSDDDLERLASLKGSHSIHSRSITEPRFSFQF